MMTFTCARKVYIFIMSIILLMQHIPSVEVFPTLTCGETVSATLVPLPKPCDGYVGEQEIISTQILPNLEHHNYAHTETSFSVLKMINATNDVTYFCIGMIILAKSDIYSRNMFSVSQFSTFNSNLSVGVMLVETSCWKSNHTKCPVQVHLRADVLETPVVGNTPDYESFWNFSRPLLAQNVGWLDALEIKGNGLGVDPVALRGLAGCSLRSLAVRGTFFWNALGPSLNDMPALRNVEISDTLIRQLPDESFTDSPNIERLQLNRNRLKKMPLPIRRLKNLKILSIESNQEEMRIHPEALNGLHSLQYVSLSNTPTVNGILEFPVLPSLTNASFANCRLGYINTTHFNLPRLLSFNLRNNSLKSLPVDAFTGLHKLQGIDLSLNELSNWPIFQENNFHIIDLSNNFLTTIDNLGLKGVTTQYLDLSHNNITHWDDTNVLGSWVPVVNLSANHITNMSDAMLLTLSALRAVDLGGNELNCADCGTGALQRWLKETRTLVLSQGERQLLRCSLPGELSGVPVVEAPFDASACLDPRPRLWMGLGLPLCVLAAVVVTAAGAGYRFRTEVAYLAHLVRVRANARPRTTGDDACLYDAFVCYSGKNRHFVLRCLANLLETPPECYRLCLFDRDFRLGSQIVTNIADSIECSTKVVVVLSKQFISSKWCQWELEMANHKLFSEDREFLVLLELEPLERARLPRLLRFLLDTRPVVRWPRSETAAAVLGAAAQLRRALGPSLRQRRRLAPARLQDGARAQEPLSCSDAGERAPLLSAEYAHRL